ncbi:MAG: hypothetical protein KAT70_08775 [Thermoplasmata archaeon]|nr:hypothetical protein [Thermoplasmata archaeon]
MTTAKMPLLDASGRVKGKIEIKDAELGFFDLLESGHFALFPTIADERVIALTLGPIITREEN